MTASNLATVSEFLCETDDQNHTLTSRLNSLESRYSEPWRQYHSLEHPLELLTILMNNLDTVRDPKIIGWAMLYHDAVYDPKASSGRNEELSAELCEAELPILLGVTKTLTVAEYIKATYRHTATVPDTDLDFFLDADLVILGADSERYDRYARDIRMEYSHVADADYTLGRIAILESLATRVEKSGLFKTELFKELYEERAQENIMRETDQLRSIV